MSASEILRKRALKQARNAKYTVNVLPETLVHSFGLFADVQENVLPEHPIWRSGDLTTTRVPIMTKAHSFCYGDLETIERLPDSYIVQNNREGPGRNKSRVNGGRQIVHFDKDFIPIKSGLFQDNREKQSLSPIVTDAINPDPQNSENPELPAVNIKEKKCDIAKLREETCDSDSGFDSSSTPPTDRKVTRSFPIDTFPIHRELFSTNPLESPNSTNSDVSSDLKQKTYDERQNSKPVGADTADVSYSSDTDATETESQNGQHEELISPGGEAVPIPIKSILKNSQTETSSKNSSVSRSETFAYGSYSRVSGTWDDVTSETELRKISRPVRKSISFTSYDRRTTNYSENSSEDVAYYEAQYSQPQEIFSRLGYCQCLYPIIRQPVVRPKLSSHSFSGAVQNYPYNPRWTWKPVARTRTVRAFQPNPVIVRHSNIGRHPSQRVVMYQSMGRNEAYLRLLANQVLSKEETEVFKEALHNFRATKSIPKLCSQLRSVITTVEKMILLVEISNRLPSHLRQDFHRLCSLHFDNYDDVLKRMAPGRQTREKAKVIAQDSSGAIRVLAKGNQKTLVITPHADREALRRTATSASESSFTIDQPVSEKSSLFKSDDSFKMFRKSLSSDNSEDTLFATLNETNNDIYSEARTYGDNKTGIYSQPMQLGSSLDSSTASESFETSHYKYNKSNQHPLVNGPENAGPMVPPSGLQFRPAIRHVTLSRAGSGNLGISIKGGKEHNTPVTIQNVEPGSRAEKMGLSPGDIILEVNGFSFQTIPHFRAVEIIKSLHNLQLTVTKPRPHLSDKIARTLGEPIPIHRLIEKDVRLSASQEGGLGFSLSGGADQTASPVISEVFKNSPAELAGLMKGDRVLKILGIDVVELTHKQIVTLATSSKNLTLRIQRRIKEEVRKVQHKGTIHSGNHVSTAVSNGLLSLPNGDGPQFASSPVIRRKSQSSLSIDGDDKENNNAVIVQSNTRQVFNVSNGLHSNNVHDAHNLKIHASHAHYGGNFDDTDFHKMANARRKYVKHHEHMAPPIHVHHGYNTRHGASPLEQNGGHGTSGLTIERRNHHSSVGDVNKSAQSTNTPANRRPFSAFIVVPTPNSGQKDGSVKTALTDGHDQRNRSRQTVMNIHPISKDSDWKI